MYTTKLTKTYGAILMGTVLLAMSSGCSLNKDSGATTPAALLAASQMTNASVPGVGSTYVPTQSAVVGRLMKALNPAGVTTTSTNCAKALTQVGTNLSQTTDPITASGLGQVLLASFGCCSDVKSGQFGATFGTGAASSASSATLNAIAQAGVNILNAHTGGLASSDPSVAPAVLAAFQQLVTSDAAISGETTQQVFISVCMAANAYGITMTGI